MSRFFAQLLLSIMIGVGAAVGFRSDVRGELNKTLREAKVSLNERANIALDSAGDLKTQVNTAVSVSAKANANTKASIKGNAKSDAKAKGSLDVQGITGGNLLDESLSDFSLDGSLDANSQTNIDVETEDLELDLKNKTKSGMDLDLSLEE